jgi:glutamate racemase
MKRKAENPIGIFDSGLGGLTIFKAVKKLLPRENIIYFGDSAHVPYGSKSKETVSKYSLEIGRFLEEKNIKLLVIACNTASALAYTRLKKTLSVPVIGVIEPGARAALKASKNRRLAVIATESTINSGAYAAAVKKQDRNAKTLQKACPLFVPLIEENYIASPAADVIVADYLKEIKKGPADTVILGCTHYPIMKKNIKKFLGKDITLIDSAQAVAAEVKELLAKENLLSRSARAAYSFYSSDAPQSFARRAKKLLKLDMPKVTLQKFS